MGLQVCVRRGRGPHLRPSRPPQWCIRYCKVTRAQCNLPRRRRDLRSSGSMACEAQEGADETAQEEDEGRQEAQAVAGAALLRVLDVGHRIDLTPDEEQNAEPGRPARVEIMAEQVQPGDEGDQQLERILLNAKMALENRVSARGRGLDSVLAARAPHLKAEYDELEKCERSHDIEISHANTSWVVRF